MSCAHTAVSSDSDSSDDASSPSCDYPQLNDDLSMPGSRKQMVTVLVTGFGPFFTQKVNASWEAVKELKLMGVAHNVNLVIAEIPVEYQSVQFHVPRLWKKHKPDLVVHVGVSARSTEVEIEQCAHRDGYKGADVTGNCAVSQCYRQDGDECIRTGIDTERLLADVNDSGCLAMAVLSSDAGRFLCEFIYYASLHEDRRRVLFVHVPPIGQPYTARELAHCLRVVVIGAMKQLDLHRPLPLPDPHMLDDLRQQRDRGLESV